MLKIRRPFASTAFSVIVTEILLMLCGEFTVFVLILSFALLCMTAILLKSRLAKHMILFLAFSILSFSVFSVFSMYYEKTTEISGYNLKVTGTVNDYPKYIDDNSYRFLIKNPTVDNVKLYGRITVYGNFETALQPGDKISFIADSISPEENSGIYKYHSLSDKTFSSAFCYKNKISVTEKYDGNSIIYKIYEYRKMLTDKLFSNMDTENAAIVAALIMGDKSYISDDMNNAIKISGISHIFAVSGMHLALWTNAFFIIFRRKAKVSISVNILAILFVLFYIAFTGFSPSVIRAGIMLISVFFAKILKRQADSLNSWGLAGTLMLLYNPFLAGNVSFLLSYIATFALIFLSTVLPQEASHRLKIKKSVHYIPRIFSSGSIMTSVGVMLMTIPISAIFFGSVSMLSPLASMLITPLTELMMIISGFSLLIPTKGMMSAHLFTVNDFLSTALSEIISFVTSFDAAVIPVNKSAVIIWFVFSAATVTLTVLFFKKKHYTTLSLLLCTSILLCIALIGEASGRNNTTIYIPEGENITSVAFSFPGKKTYLYGTGGSFKAGSDIISFFNSHGEYNIDSIIIPGNTVYESQNTEYYKRRLLPDKVFEPSFSIHTQSFFEQINENESIFLEYSDSFSAAILYSGNIKTVICSLPSSDFSDKSEDYKQGDILICRNKIPKTLNTENFSSVIVITDKDLLTQKDSILTTKDKSINITIKGDSYAIN